MRHLIATAACVACLLAGGSAAAQTIYPVDRAEILVGSRFDLKVEFPGLAKPADIALTLNGEDHAKVLGRAADFIEREDGEEQSSLMLRDVSLPNPGTYKVRATDGTHTREVTWTVYATGARRARNVILFIGDGLSPAHRIAARLLSKGIAEGKAFGKLAMDDMPQMALVATAGLDTIIADSANSASAYATGHKTSNAAMGVYADRTLNPFDDPRVETITSLVKRRLGLAVGIVTDTEIQDASPAAMVAHTRRRREYDRITEHFFAARPDVIMGGGLANFLPQSTPGSKRKDEQDFVAKFREAGYAYATTAAELAAAKSSNKLLGLFNLGNMDGVLDRIFLKGGTVAKFPDQPDLTAQLGSALDILSRNPAGFFLMVEAGLIDTYTHAHDMERAVYDTIMLDNTVRLARDWARARGDDTLILVIADHNHSISLIGTVDEPTAAQPNQPLRERVRLYERAGFPNYPPPDANGYPARIDVSRRLALLSASAPNSSVHSGEDVILTAAGPGSERVRGQIDNTEVFRVMVEALGLGDGGALNEKR